MILSVLLVVSLAQTPPSERLCISRGLQNAQFAELGEQFYAGRDAAVAEIIDPIGKRCSEQWKWSAEARKWHIQDTGAQAALGHAYKILPKGVSRDQLRALFSQLSEADQAGLTTEGRIRIGEKAYSRILRRVAVSLSLYDLDTQQLEITIQWFVVHARANEASERLKIIAAGK